MIPSLYLGHFHIFFFTKYSATHEQVTRSAPSRERNDAKNPYVSTKKTKDLVSRHSQLRKEINFKEANGKGGDVSSVKLLQEKAESIQHLKQCVTDSFFSAMLSLIICRLVFG